MKILLVHNDYAKYSGEEAVVDKMNQLFKRLGHSVAQLRMSTAGLRENLMGKAKGFIAGLYSPAGVKAMAEALDREKPDIVNVHNLYPFISPAALRECKKRGVPVIMTVHNYRLICPTGLFMRNNAPCELCLEKGNEWGCVKYNCEGSLLKSVGYAGRNAVARLRRHYLDCVDYFACLSDFQRQKLIQAGFDPAKLIVIPNSITLPTPPPPIPNPQSPIPKYVAFSGRISPEKGVDLIMEVARRHPEIPFKFAGAVSPNVNLSLPDSNNVELKGYLSGDELEKFYKDAAFFVLSSKCYEGFPMAILEAAKYSKPMVAPNHGAFPEIIKQGNETEEGGVLFTPGDVDELEKVIVGLWNNPEEINRLGQNAYKNLQNHYTSDVVANMWKNLLQKVINPFLP